MSRPYSPAGGIVVADNVSFHNGAGVEDAIEARGAELRLLPEYSPDLNPIELVFHPLRALLGKAAERKLSRFSMSNITCSAEVRSSRCGPVRVASDFGLPAFGGEAGRGRELRAGIM
jgi:hypothetical protein